MKKVLLISAMMLIAMVGMAKATIKTVVVTTNPLMHCDNCENKIKGNLRFEKGIKTIECDIPGQRVTITYDAGKTNAEAIIKSFGKFGYKATEVKAAEQTGKTESSPKKDKGSK